MDHSASFARHFARIVSLMLHEAGNVDEQKLSLRALVTLSKNGPVALVSRDLQLTVNDQPIAGALTGVQDVAAQMAAHSMLRVDIGASTKAADILGVARIIASNAKPGDFGEQARQKFTALGAKTVKIETPEPPPPPVQSLSEAPTVIVPAEPGAPAPAAQAAPPPRVSVPNPAAAVIAELVGSQDVSKLTPEIVFSALDAAKSEDAVTKVLDDLVSLTEHNVRVGRGVVVADLLHGVVQRDAEVSDGDIKRAYAFAIRRLSKPALLRAVATQIPKKPERRQHFYEVLQRTAEEGAEALIEQISQAQTSEDRRSLFEVLTVLDAAVPALSRMLGDSRWFVVRNAADLLGEMAASAAQDDLIGLLRHGDDRVRRSATNALLKLGTPPALKAVYEAVNDASPEVRMQAAAAISTKRDGRTSSTLIRAIEDEQDGDVQVAMIAALGRVATSDAVQKLVKLAEPEARLFKKKATAIRVAAVQALGEAKTPAALTALKDLTDDKEREVRETAARALAQSR